MKSVYRVLALLVAAGVMFQAAAIAYAVFGLAKWIEGGGTLDKGVFESGAKVGGDVGFSLHATGGIMVVPAIALLLLISSFFAKVPGGVKWALIVFIVAVIQVALGLFSHSIAGLGWLHGVNALILFGTAVSASMRVNPRRNADVETAPSRVSVG